MNIRAMMEQDIPSVVEIMLLNYDGVVAAEHSPAVVAKGRAEVTEESIRQQMAWKQMCVVETAGQIVATGALAQFGTFEEPKLSISQFFVRPGLHRRGIGRQLMEHLLRLAREQRCARLHVPSSRNGIPFYRSLGFAVDAAQPDTVDEITWMSMDMRRD